MRKQLKSLDLGRALMALFIFTFAAVSLITRSMPAEAQNSPYAPDIASKLVTRCDLIKDYLSKTVRISELSARQNKVRGWEYVLRHLDDLESSYGKFSVDYSELSANSAELRKQLEQFKVDFEAYDSEFQKLLNTDCKNSPEAFWKQLDTVISFRAGIALSSENYKVNLGAAISKEGAKW